MNQSQWYNCHISGRNVRTKIGDNSNIPLETEKPPSSIPVTFSSPFTMIDGVELNYESDIYSHKQL